MTASKIEWTDRSDWNPIRGCTRASAGCINCYAEVLAARFSKPGQWGHGFAEMVSTPTGPDHRWTGKVELVEDRLTLPLRWRQPTPGRNKVFASSTSDFFHESLTFEQIDRLFAVMALAPNWTFQLLTKRSDRMREYLSAPQVLALRIQDVIDTMEPDGVWQFKDHEPWVADNFPLHNVWLGVSVEDQQAADRRIPDLIETPAAKRFVSFEPLIGPVWVKPEWRDWIDWAIVGGESGHGARPMHPDWVNSLRDQFVAGGLIPFHLTDFFFKQWGEWAPHPTGEPVTMRQYHNQIAYIDVTTGAQKRNPNRHTDATMRRIGKGAAGRLLDGREYSEIPR